MPEDKLAAETSVEELKQHVVSLYDLDRENRRDHAKFQERFLDQSDKLSKVTEQIKDNELKDFQSNEKIMEEIRKVAEDSGKKSGAKRGKLWALIGTITSTILLKLLEYLLS